MIHGVINVYKEKGFTSHDVVAKLRGILGQRKIGHTGTLDPDAQGVLPVCLGKATKICDMLTDKDKIYETVLLLGKETDTQDVSGSVLNERTVDGLSEVQVLDVIKSFIGDYDQIPPMYSALKVNGKKLYELAREGKEVERKPRTVHIFYIENIQIELPRVHMEVRCSKGTYIRTLCHDIGQRLKCGGCMEELLRTKVERFAVCESVKLDEIAYKKEVGKLQDIVVPIDSMFADYSRIVIKKQWETLAHNGNKCTIDTVEGTFAPKEGTRVRLYDEAGRFIAIYQYNQIEETFSIVKMFYDGKD